jgi:hypothetical protein
VDVDAFVVTPVFDSFKDIATIVGHLYAVVPWKQFLIDELPQGTPPVVAVVKTSCGHTFSFEIVADEDFSLLKVMRMIPCTTT